MKIEACLTDDIARTLLIPLWCCATPCRANPRAAYDPVAVDVLKQLDFDFSEIRRSFKEYGQVCCHGTFSIPSGRMPWRPRGNGASSFWQPECSTISPRT